MPRGTIRISIHNEDAAIRFISWYRNEKKRAVKKVVRKSALRIEGGAKKRVPRDTGHLARSIHIRTYRDGLGAMVGTAVRYGVYVEYGTGIYAEKGNGRKTPWVYYNPRLKRFVWTRGMKPQPYLRPAYKEEVPNFNKSLRIALKGE